MRPLLHRLFSLRQNHLDVTRITHIRIDASVRPVRPTSLLRRLVDLDMLDDEIAGIETLGVGVGFGVLEQRDQVGGGFLWPARLGDAEFFA